MLVACLVWGQVQESSCVVACRAPYCTINSLALVRPLQYHTSLGWLGVLSCEEKGRFFSLSVLLDWIRLSFALGFLSGEGTYFVLMAPPPSVPSDLGDHCFARVTSR